MATMHPDPAAAEATDDRPEPDPPLPADGTEPAAGPDGTAVETAPGAVQEVTALDRVEAALAAVAERMDREAERAAFRERVVDRQHADIERLRAAERSGLLRPVITDLCRLRNGLLRQAATVPAQMSAEQVATLLLSFADAAEEALDRCGVGVLPAAPGTPFVAGRHQVVGTVEVDDPAQDGAVDSVLQDGYVEVDGGRVVVPARVRLRRAAHDLASTTTEEQADD